MLSRVPSLNWLRVFEAAARFENFAAAARSLNMTAPAVSQQIKALEGYLGEDLFERGPRSVGLTVAGRAYLPAMRHALQSIDITTVSLFGQKRQSPVHVQSIPIFATSWLSGALTEFYERNADIQLTISTANHIEEFRFGYNDFNIVIGAGPLPSAQIDTLFGESLVPVAVPDICAEIRAPVDLLGYKLIEISTNNAGWLNVFDPLDGVDLSMAHFTFVDNTITAFSLAAQGGAIALARPPVSDVLQRQFGLHPVLPDIVGASGEYYRLIAHPGRPMSNASSRFRDWLLERVGAEVP